MTDTLRLKRAFGNCERCSKSRCAIWFVGNLLLCRSCRDEAITVCRVASVNKSGSRIEGLANLMLVDGFKRTKPRNRGGDEMSSDIFEALDELHALFPNERVAIEVEYSVTFKGRRFNVTLPDYTGVTADSIEQCMAIVNGLRERKVI
jgi:hypothetical protein